jgi:Coenzyme PQQ synthesis protein D (PqqD)
MKSKILGSSIVVAVRHQVSCDLAGEAVILDIKSGIYYGLNAVGARIWNLVQEPQTVGKVRDAILQEFDVEPDHCERELMALLQEMATNGLIEVHDETAA